MWPFKKKEKKEKKEEPRVPLIIYRMLWTCEDLHWNKQMNHMVCADCGKRTKEAVWPVDCFITEWGSYENPIEFIRWNDDM